MAGEFGPPVDGHFAIFSVKTDHNVTGKGIAGFMQKTGIFDRSRAQNHPIDAVVEVVFDGVHVAYAATEFYGQFPIQRVDNGFNG